MPKVVKQPYFSSVNSIQYEHLIPKDIEVVMRLLALKDKELLELPSIDHSKYEDFITKVLSLILVSREAYVR